jgi:hypothetical protein
MSPMKLGSLAPQTYNFTGNSDTSHDEELSFVIGILLQSPRYLIPVGNSTMVISITLIAQFSGRDRTEFFKITHLFVRIQN